jgi:hypothetical protein
VADPARDPEAIRRRFAYRRLILTGKVRLPHAVAARLIGPDCAYHLYRQAGRGSATELDTRERIDA